MITNSWECQDCHNMVFRHKGESDVTCECGAEYNASGQRLRDDWRDNPSWRYDDIDDMEGFEIQQLRKEAFDE
jgi:hypothetical protein